MGAKLLLLLSSCCFVERSKNNPVRRRRRHKTGSGLLFKLGDTSVVSTLPPFISWRSLSIKMCKARSSPWMNGWEWRRSYFSLLTFLLFHFFCIVRPICKQIWCDAEWRWWWVNVVFLRNSKLQRWRSIHGEKQLLLLMHGNYYLQVNRDSTSQWCSDNRAKIEIISWTDAAAGLLPHAFAGSINRLV